MTLFEIRSDIQLVAEKLVLSRNQRYVLAHLEYLIHKYRSKAIRDDWKRNGTIEPIWLQDFGRVPTTKVLSSDDPAIAIGSQWLSKIYLPTPVSIIGEQGENIGYYRIASTSKQKRYYPITVDRYFDLAGPIRKKFCYYFTVGNSLYVNGDVPELNPVLILDNPMEGYTIRTDNIQSGFLEDGKSYVVETKYIINNSVSYSTGSTFVAVGSTFTGPGTVKFLDQKRMMSEFDSYPMSFTMAQEITQKIFTIDLKIESEQLSNTRNEGNDAMVIADNAKLQGS